MSSFYSRGNINNINDTNEEYHFIEAPAREIHSMDENIENAIMNLVKGTILSNYSYDKIRENIHIIVINSSPYQARNIIRRNESGLLEIHMSIPDMQVPFHVENFPNLTALHILSANLNYEFDYSKMKQLRELHIENNQGAVQFTNSIRFLENLESLELIDCNLTSIPNGITKLKKLKKLNLMANLLRELPEELANIKNLTTVIIENNEFELFPPCLGNSHIRLLRIGKNRIREFPNDIMEKMVELQIFDIHSMETDYRENPLIPICKLESLRILNVNFVKGITGIPSKIGELKELIEFHMVDAYDLQNIHENIGNLSKLVILNITHCSVSSLPEGICKMKNLAKLILTNRPESQENEKLKILPSNLKKLKSLKHLSFRSAAINEDSLKYIGGLSNLTYIEMADCEITQLHDSFCNLVNLETLVLLENKLTALPEHFGNLKKLKSLNLQANRISTLPDSFQHLSALEHLYIDENQLTDLPAGFANLPKLHTFYIGHNRLGNRLNQIIIELVPPIQGNGTIKYMNVVSNGTRFTQEAIDRIEAFNEAGRIGTDMRMISYIDEFETDNPNILPGGANFALVNPAEQAMEIHKEFDRINRDELLSILGGLKTYPKDQEENFNSMLYNRIKSYLAYFKEKDAEQYKEIMGHLATLENKMKYANFTDNVDTLNLFYTVIEYVERQPVEYKAYYAYNYVLSNALAYCENMEDRTSCTLGIKERIVMDLASGVTGVNEADMLPEYIELARIIQQDKIPAEWTNINDLKVKKTKLNIFANACITDEEHLEHLKKLKTVEARKEYVMRCITDKIVESFADENDRNRFKGANPPKVVSDYVEILQDMLSDDYMSGGRKHKMNRKSRRKAVLLKTRRNKGGKNASRKITQRMRRTRRYNK